MPESFIAFAHGLIDGGFDLVHGHSSHHVRPIEVYRERLILYGCGDLIDDYEGIGSHARYRVNLGIIYLPTLERATGRLVGLSLVPMQMRRFRLCRADEEGARWLAATLTRISRSFSCRVEPDSAGRFALRHGGT